MMGKFTYNIEFIDLDGKTVTIPEPMEFHAPLNHNDRIRYMDITLAVNCIYHELTGYPTAKCIGFRC